MSARWFKVKESLPDHYKTLNLAGLLNVSDNEALGIVIRLFQYCSRQALETGRLQPYGPRLIAKACQWPPQKADELVKALQDCGGTDDDGNRKPGFLDGLTVHDWTKEQAQAIHDRYDGKTRKERRSGESSAPEKRGQDGLTEPERTEALLKRRRDQARAYEEEQKAKAR